MLRLTLLLSASLLTATAALAQVANGRAVYERSVAIDIDPADLPHGMQIAAVDLPPSFSERAELLFTAEASLYRDIVVEPAPEANGPPTRGPKVTIVAGEPEAYYFERATRRVRQVRTILDKPFHVADDALAFDWHDTGASGTDAVTGLPTREATAVHPDGDTLYVDYTPSVALPYGPAEFTGLPGLIVGLRKGRTTIQLRELEFLDDVPELGVPETDGNTVTRERFEVLRKRKEEALMRQASGSSTAVVRQ